MGSRRSWSGFLTVAAVLALAACDGSAQPTTTTASVPTTTTPSTMTTTTNAPSATTTSEVTTTTTIPSIDPDDLTIESFPVPDGSRPHDVAPAADGGVWYTAQNRGALGWLDPETGDVREIPLGSGSRPHGVIVDDAGDAWVTDGGLDAIVRVDAETDEVTTYRLPDGRPSANLNTAVFDDDGILWFTGQAGIYGRLDPSSGSMEVFDAPLGRGPYGITSTPFGSIYYASLAGSYVGAINDDGSASVLTPPTADQGARRVWSDSNGAIWVSEWNSGSLSRHDPSSGEWETWRLPGDDPAAYAVYVDERDIVWVSDFGANAMVRFDPGTEAFTVVPLPHSPGDVRQILGRPGEIWGAESAADHLVLIRTR